MGSVAQRHGVYGGEYLGFTYTREVKENWQKK
jgi:hypothetical protein